MRSNAEPAETHVAEAETKLAERPDARTLSELVDNHPAKAVFH